MKKQLIEKILANAKNTLSEDKLNAMSETELQAMADGFEKQPEKVEAGKKIEQAPDADAQAADAVNKIRAGTVAEMKRIAMVNKIAANHEEIRIQAIDGGWGEDKVKLEVLQASRPNVNIITKEQTQMMPQTLEAAAVMAGGIGQEVAIKQYGEKIIEGAGKLFRHGISLQELIIEAARMNGYQPRSFRSEMPQIIRAAFSTMSLPGILSNVANKFLLAGFDSVEQVWRIIAKRTPVKDFKQITSYRMTGGFEFEEVGPDGELKHGKAGEESMSNQAKTYGKMFGITRTDIINDDLGALTAVPRKIGRGGALKLNSVFWKIFLNNSAFFTANRGNYKAGAGTALGSAGLKAAQLAFKKQVVDGHPLGVIPRILLVPSELEVTADELMTSTQVNTGGSSTSDKVPNKNVWAGKYQQASSAYLSNEEYDGYSEDGWYLLANPEDLPVIEVVFLNGQENPIVESADADFNTLGIQFRGYFDFGVALQEYRGGVKMKGKA